MLDDKAQDLIFRDAHTPQGFLGAPVPDEKLKQVFGKPRVNMFEMTKLVGKHLQ